MEKCAGFSEHLKDPQPQSAGMEEYGSQILDRFLSQIESQSNEKVVAIQTKLVMKQRELKWEKAQHRETFDDLAIAERQLKDAKQELNVTKKELNAAVDRILELETAMDKANQDNKTLRENIIKSSSTNAPRHRGGSKSDSPSPYRKQGGSAIASSSSSRGRRSSTGGSSRGTDNNNNNKSPKSKYRFEIGAITTSPSRDLVEDSIKPAPGATRRRHVPSPPPPLATLPYNTTPSAATKTGSKAPPGLTDSFLTVPNGCSPVTWMVTASSLDGGLENQGAGANPNAAVFPLVDTPTTAGFLLDTNETPPTSNKSSDKSKNYSAY